MRFIEFNVANCDKFPLGEKVPNEIVSRSVIDMSDIRAYTSVDLEDELEGVYVTYKSGAESETLVIPFESFKEIHQKINKLHVMTAKEFLNNTL